MKKILVFSVAYYPFVGGAEIAVKEITDRIADIEFDMITLNLDGKQKFFEKIGNVNVYRIGGTGRLGKLLFPFGAWRKAKALHRKQPYGATWSIMASFSGFAALFFKFSYPDIPFILTLQEGDPIDHIKRQVRFVQPLFRRIFTKADHIQAISNYLADFAKSMNATSPIVVIPNGVDLSVFAARPLASDIESAQKIISKKDGEKIIITTSRLVEKNGIKDVVNALSILPENFKFVILGTGPLEENLKSQVKYLKLEERVVFAGFVEHKKIPSFLAISDIFIRPSLSEGMGNSFIEAMSAGVPVVATPVGGIPDFLRDGETGLFCEPRNPKSIAEKVLLLSKNSELRDRLARQAKEMAVKSYDWNLIAERIKTEIFDRV